MFNMVDSKWSERKEKYLESKLKAASQEERLQKVTEHSKKLFENPPEIRDKPIQKILMTN